MLTNKDILKRNFENPFCELRFETGFVFCILLFVSHRQDTKTRQKLANNEVCTCKLYVSETLYLTHKIVVVVFKSVATS